jgi:hypothetical protein
MLSFSAIQRQTPLLLLLLLLLFNKPLRILLPYFLSLVNKIFSNFFLSFFLAVVIVVFMKKGF